MITKHVEFNVICNICGIDGCNCGGAYWLPSGKVTPDNYDECVPRSEKGVRDIRKNARECGWICKRGCDICPKCQDELGIKVLV